MVDFTESSEPKQLTQNGFYHDITMDTTVKTSILFLAFCIMELPFQNFKFFLSVFSSSSSCISVSIQTLSLPTQALSKWHGSSMNCLYYTLLDLVFLGIRLFGSFLYVKSVLLFISYSGEI